MKNIFSVSLCMLLFAVVTKAQTIVTVSTSIQFQNALDAAVPGQVIALAPGLYTRSGGFKAPAHVNSVQVVGGSNAIISSNDLNSGYAFALRGNNYWTLDGFTVYNSQKGIVLDSSHHNTLRNITINKIGDEGIHIRSYSSYNQITDCFVDSTGLVSSGNGEGIYIGSAVSNWPTYTQGNPDTCNYNAISGNRFGDHVVSENVDIKEGTTGGSIYGNIFNGVGLNGVNYADSWVDIKGNHYTVGCNYGVNTIADGFQTHINYPGYGDYNEFYANTLYVNGTGYGINIETSSSNGTATHNVVYAANGSVGLTNIPTQPNGNQPCLTSTPVIQPLQISYSISPNPATDFIQLTTQGHGETYVITDALGQVKKTGTIDSATMNIDVHELADGLYLLTVSGLGKSIKFIKQ